MVHPFLFLQWLADKLHLTAFFTDTLHVHDFNHVVYGWLVLAILILAGFFATRSLKQIPTGLQNFMEVVVESIEGLIVEVMGPKGLRYFPLLATISLFILVSNLLGLVPGFYPPTANLNTNAALALTVFVMTHVIGFKEHGLHYIKHFTGPMLAMAPLMFIIEVIGHIARPVSLTLRLFGNMWGHEIVLMIFLGLAWYTAPVMMALGILVAFIQAFVFTLLAMIYFAGALEEAH